MRCLEVYHQTTFSDMLTLPCSRWLSAYQNRAYGHWCGSNCFYLWLCNYGALQDLKSYPTPPSYSSEEDFLTRSLLKIFHHCLWRSPFIHLMIPVHEFRTFKPRHDIYVRPAEGFVQFSLRWIIPKVRAENNALSCEWDLQKLGCLK